MANLAKMTQIISERLRYRELPEIVGRSIKINTLSSIELDVREALEDFLPATCELVDTYAPTLSIKKLGLLTLDFAIPASFLDNKISRQQI